MPARDWIPPSRLWRRPRCAGVSMLLATRRSRDRRSLDSRRRAALGWPRRSDLADAPVSLSQWSRSSRLFLSGTALPFRAHPSAQADSTTSALPARTRTSNLRGPNTMRTNSRSSRVPTRSISAASHEASDLVGGVRRQQRIVGQHHEVLSPLVRSLKHTHSPELKLLDREAPKVDPAKGSTRLHTLGRARNKKAHLDLADLILQHCPLAGCGRTGRSEDATSSTA